MSEIDNKEESSMEETTTPSEQVIPDGAAAVIGGIAVDQDGNALVIDESTDEEQPQPDQPVQEAEVTPEETSTEPKVEESDVTPETKNLLDWAKKKGLDTEDASPAVIKALQIAREAEQTFHKGQQQQSELRKSLEAFQYPQAAPQVQPQVPEYDEYGNPSEAAPIPQQTVGIDPRDLKIAMLDFQMNHRDYEQGSDLDAEMGRIVGENPVFWMNNLNQAYRIAKATLNESTLEAKLEAAREEARRDERKKLEAKSKLTQPAQQATGTPRNAQDFSKLTPENIDAWLATNPTPSEYKKRHNEMNQVLASL